MVEPRTRRFATVLALIAGVALSGCEVSQDGGQFPPPPAETFTALYFSYAGDGAGSPWPYQPWPTDTLFSGTKDGTINIPSALADNPAAAIYLGTPLAAALNTLDGFSTSAFTTTPFSRPIDGSTLTASTVRVVELNMVAPNTPSSTAPVRRVLALGTDYKVEVSGDTDSAGKVLKITPLKPFKYSSGANGIGYLFLVTNGVKDTSGQSAEPDEIYAASKATPSCTALPASAQGLCGIVKWQLQVAGAVFGSTFPNDVVVSWNYTTQSVDDTFAALAAKVGPQTIAVQMVTGAKSPGGAADLFAGTLQVPYYSKVPASANDASILSSFWVSATPPPPTVFPNATAPYFLTRYNPVPVAQGGLRAIPVFGSRPNQAATGCPKPAGGWPVVVVMHGLKRNRTDAAYVADSYASKCYVVVAIDQALHGITDTTSPFYQAANERTFNVDLVNNTTLTGPPDGKIDPSGVHALAAFISNPLMERDSLRQSEVDLGVLAKSIASKLDLDGDGVQDADANRIHFAGLSLGAIVGISHAKFSPGVKSAAVAAPGGVLTVNAIRSPSFNSLFNPALAASSTLFVPNSTFYNNFYRDVQTLIDPADPINHICECSVQQPMLLFQMKDDNVVINESTQLLVTAGDLRQIKTVGANPLSPKETVWVNMIKGSHGSFIDPTSSLAATTEMQKQAVGLAVSADAGTPAVIITDKTVVEAQ